jgi:AraC-like DNA-binding protein
MPDDIPMFAPSDAHDFLTLSAIEGSAYLRRASFGNELLAPGSGDRFRLAHTRLGLGEVTIDFVMIDCGCSFEVIQVEELGFYTFKLPIEGVSEYRIAGKHHRAAPGQVFATNPTESVRKRFISPYSQIIVTVPRARLEASLVRELSRPLREPLEFDLTPQWGGGSDQFIGMVRLLWLSLGAEQKPGHPRITSHLEDALLASMLVAIPNNYSSDLEQPHHDIAPFYVRRAESFIHGHLGAQIAMDDIIAASGASSRSLYYGFRRWRQTTPMGYLKAVRLERARAALEQAALTGGANVTDIAVQVGYRHFNHFSGDYKSRFGKRPSDTLRRR